MTMHKIINSDIIELSADEEAEVRKELAARKARCDATASDRAMASIRKRRNRRLEETDHYALADLTLTDEMKAYRAALRDLPSTISDSLAFLQQWAEFEQGKDGVIDPWPTKP